MTLMGTTPRATILVVDDAQDTLSMLSEVLSQAGMTVLVAQDGQQALSMIDRITPDAILMDAVMPGLDGFETTRALKLQPSAQHIPVIFMTGLSDTEHIVKALECGGVDYVTKPIITAELVARIRVHLANAKTTQSAQAALDAAGRYLLATDANGVVLWCTPQAARILSASHSIDRGIELPPEARHWLQSRARETSGASDNWQQTGEDGRPELSIAYLGKMGPQEFLLRLSETNAHSAEEILQGAFHLTAREAQVMHWVARGKSNRDIGTILNLSPRTVNKHLEQIFAKLGVENRTAAAALATAAINRS